MRRRLLSILFAAVLFVSFAASAGQASADPGKGNGSGGTITTYGVTWE